jgi:hypothetical protein
MTKKILEYLIHYTKNKNYDKDNIEKRKIIVNSIKDYFNIINKNIINNCLFCKNLSFNFNFNNQTFYSSSTTIIKHPSILDRYIINTRIINYKLDNIGKSNCNKKCITLNKISVLDKFFNSIYSKYLFPHNYNSKYVGIEDIRLFNFKNEIYFIGSYYNNSNNKVQIVSNKYKLGKTYKPLIINPTFTTNFIWEKNWVFFENNGELNVIYKWSPIYICKIDYINKNLNLIKSIENVPSIFTNFRGSTNGVNYNNKIWFLVHEQKVIINDIKCYTHNFVVFDTNMNLLGYSKTFNFENKIVEFCVGMELTYNNNFVITYSTLDCSTKLLILSPDYIESLIIYI